MYKHCSIILNLIFSGSRWEWYLHHRSFFPKSKSIIHPYPLPNSVDLESLTTQFNKIIAMHDFIELRSNGINAYNLLFSPEVKKILEQAEEGDIHFIIPCQWKQIPFELCYIPEKGFLGNIFQIGTTIITSDKLSSAVNNHVKEHLPHEKMLIIADPAGDLPYAYDEGNFIKNIAYQHDKMVHFLSSADKNRTLKELVRSNIVHFTGHSAHGMRDGEKVFGWKLVNDQILDIEEIKVIGKNAFVPHLIFSNSCNASEFTNNLDLSGIAGAFLQAGVALVIGPITKIHSNDSEEFAKLFYHHFFQGKSPSSSLLSVKKDLHHKKPDSVTPLYYRMFGDPLDSISSQPYKEPSSEKKATKIPKLGLGLLFITLLFTALMVIMKPKIISIVIGRTNYGVKSVDKHQKNIHEAMAEPAQMVLKKNDSKSPFTFKCDVVPGSYPRIFEYLHNGQIDIGFISPFCYIYHRFLQPDSLAGLRLIGRNIDHEERLYYSGFVVHKQSNIKTLEDINEKNVHRLILGAQPLSTSTRIIPSIYCVKNGLESLIKKEDDRPRPEMIEKIKESKSDHNIVGVLSNEDWARTEDQDLRFIIIDAVPIPYDPVYVDSSHWRKKVRKDQENTLFEALGNSIRRLDNSWEDEYPQFVDYVASGIIMQRIADTSILVPPEKSCYIVNLMPTGYDLYNMTQQLDSLTKINTPCKANIVNFKKNLTRLPGQLEKINIGTGILVKSDNLESHKALLYVESTQKNNLLGMHVLMDL